MLSHTRLSNCAICDTYSYLRSLRDHFKNSPAQNKTDLLKKKKKDVNFVIQFLLNNELDILLYNINNWGE
jgi:hypothetical protein